MNLPLEAAAFPPKTITRLTDEQQFVLSAFHWDKPNKSTEKKLTLALFWTQKCMSHKKPLGIEKSKMHKIHTKETVSTCKKITLGNMSWNVSWPEGQGVMSIRWEWESPLPISTLVPPSISQSTTGQRMRLRILPIYYRSSICIPTGTK